MFEAIGAVCSCGDADEVPPLTMEDLPAPARQDDRVITETTIAELMEKYRSRGFNVDSRVRRTHTMMAEASAAPPIAEVEAETPAEGSEEGDEGHEVSEDGDEVYFGNLATGLVDEEVIRGLVEPAMHELPEYSSALGPLITKVTLMERSRFCFVQFQNAELATRAIAIFDDTELFGQRLRVRRPRLTPELLEATKSLRQSVARPLSGVIANRMS